MIPSFPRFDPEAGTTILEPGGSGPGRWVGCPGVTWDAARERLVLTYRNRRPRGGEQPDRGWECRVAESRDGIAFADVWSVRKDDLGPTSLERFCLRAGDDGRWLLWISYEHPEDGRRRIDVLEADAPDAFDVSRARTVLTPAATGTAAVKDPYAVRAGPGWLMYVSTLLTDDGPAPTCLAVSADGRAFRWLGETLPVGGGRDRYQARLSGIPLGQRRRRALRRRGQRGRGHGGAPGRRRLVRPALVAARLGGRAVARLTARDRVAPLRRRARARRRAVALLRVRAGGRLARAAAEPAAAACVGSTSCARCSRR